MKQKDILVIIILLFVFVLTWIGGTIYHSAVSSTISEETSKNISPIKPFFDTKIINKLKERQRITPAFELGNVAPAPASLPSIISPQSASGEAKLLL